MNPKEWSPIELQVPGLGNLSGLCFDGEVCQYMGVPYATIPGRFRRSQPIEGPWPEKRWDGTKLGYEEFRVDRLCCMIEKLFNKVLQQAFSLSATSRFLPYSKP